MTKLAQTKQELEHALAALAAGGSGSVGNIECRVASLQQTLLDTPASSLSDIEARLQVMRSLIAGLGEPGYLMHLIDATIVDLRAMQNKTGQAGGEAGPGDSAVRGGSYSPVAATIRRP